MSIENPNPEKLEILECGILVPKKGYFVYFLINEDEIVYVGKTENLWHRVGEHTRDKIFNKMSFLECYDDVDMEIKEAYNIIKFMPKYNKGVPSNYLWKSKAQIKRDLGINEFQFTKLLFNHKLTDFNGYFNWSEVLDRLESAE